MAVVGAKQNELKGSPETGARHEPILLRAQISCSLQADSYPEPSGTPAAAAPARHPSRPTVPRPCPPPLPLPPPPLPIPGEDTPRASPGGGT